MMRLSDLDRLIPGGRKVEEAFLGVGHQKDPIIYT